MGSQRWGGAPAGGPGRRPILSITALYEGRLLVKVLDIRTDEVIEPGGYKLGSRIQTAAFGPVKSSTILAQTHGPYAGGPVPGQFTLTEPKKKRVVVYHGAGPRSPADPLTQLFRLALLAPEASPCAGTLAIQDGRQTYDLTLTGAGTGALPEPQAKLGLAGPVKCRIGFQPIAGFKRGASLRNPVMNGDLYVTFARAPAARVWVMSEITVPTVLGAGRIALTGLQIHGAPPPPMAPPQQTPPARKKTRNRA